MKTRLSILLFAVFVSPHLFGQNADDENIKQLVMAETDCLFTIMMLKPGSPNGSMM